MFLLEKFVEFARKERADVVGLSALLTTTMISMKEIIEALENAGLRENVKVMIGGAPVTESYMLPKYMQMATLRMPHLQLI
jgi:5-methyltetrahydrofolate--homocysteine methyltransferase